MKNERKRLTVEQLTLPRTEKKNIYRSLSRPAYDNIGMFSPEGIQMANIPKNRATWYVKNNLAIWKGEGEAAIKLTFTPNGPGEHNGIFLVPKESICVVCGRCDLLTRHHIVPSMFRRRSLVLVRSRSFDIVLLCVTCHDRYEAEALKLKQALANDLALSIPLSGIDPYDDHSKEYNIARKVERYKYFLSSNSANLPEKRRQEMEIFIRENAGASSVKPVPLDVGDLIIQGHTGRLDEFVRIWREHFISTCNPQFLPPAWTEYLKDPSREIE